MSAGIGMSATARQDEREQHCYSIYAERVSQACPRLGDQMRALNSSLGARRFAIRARAMTSAKRRQPVVLGGGFGSTGTSSMYIALRALGLRLIWHSKVQGYFPDLLRQRLGVINAWKMDFARCDARLDSLNYELPRNVEAYIDRPTAESMLDLWWANSRPDMDKSHGRRGAVVLVTRRDGMEWAKSRLRKYGSSMNLPTDRPCCGIKFSMVNVTVAARRLDLHAALLRCFVPRGQLIEADITAANGTMGLMRRLSWAVLGSDLPPNARDEFPRPKHVNDSQLLGRACDAPCRGRDCAFFLLRSTCEALAWNNSTLGDCDCSGCCIPMVASTNGRSSAGQLGHGGPADPADSRPRWQLQTPKVATVGRVRSFVLPHARANTPRTYYE